MHTEGRGGGAKVVGQTEIPQGGQMQQQLEDGIGIVVGLDIVDAHKACNKGAAVQVDGLHGMVLQVGEGLGGKGGKDGILVVGGLW